MILVGCSGWSYDDWIGNFYPIELAKRKDEWLSYYAQYFRTVEINSTFYRPPGERQVQSWIKKAKDFVNFEYSVKVPQLVTHKALVEGNTERAIFWASSFEKTCVKPLAEAGLLGSVLLQLSPYFKNEGSSLAMLKGVLDSISHQEYNYAAELRHRSWLTENGRELEHNIKEASVWFKYHVEVEILSSGRSYDWINQATDWKRSDCATKCARSWMRSSLVLHPM